MRLWQPLKLSWGNRRKDLEYPWILKGAFFVQAYTVMLENGKTYIVYAHDFNDMEFFLTRLEAREAPVKVVPTDSDFVPSRPKLSYVPDRRGEPKRKPFWYRGRVYEMKAATN